MPGIFTMARAAVLHAWSSGREIRAQVFVIAGGAEVKDKQGHTSADSGTASDARGGAHDYSRVLLAAGGSEVEALTRAGNHSAMCVALYAAPPYDMQVPALPVSRLSVTLTAARVSGGIEGERLRTFETPRHALFLTPAGAPTRWHKESPSRHVNIYFHAEAFADDERDRGHGLDSPLLNVTLSGWRGIVDELVDELEGRAPHAAEAVDSLARLLLVRLARRQASRAERAQPLSVTELARLRDHAMAHLGERILVADMAAAVGLPPSRFAHAFTACTGLSPHQFVLGLRLGQALELLARTPLGLADIAAACGFASQQHLTHQMRKRMGVTPGRYRQSMRTP